MFKAPKRLSMTAAGGLVALAGTSAVAVLLSAGSASAAADQYAGLPNQITLTGVVRDFKEKSVTGGHADMENQPASGFGQYAGNIWPMLGENGKPVFLGGGRKINTQAKSSGGDAIAYSVANTTFVPGFEGDGLPQYTEALLNDSSGIPATSVKLGKASLNSNNTTTVVYEVAELQGGKNLSFFSVTIPGSLSVSATSPTANVSSSGGNKIVRWDVANSFAKGSFSITVNGHVQCNDQLNALRCRSGDTPTYAHFVAPTATPASGKFALPTSAFMTSSPMGDSNASTGASDQGGITTKASFDQWFTDVPGVNISMALPITLVRQPGTNVYVFDDKLDPTYKDLGGFFPVNNQLLGNSKTDNKNFHFTYELSTEFFYDAGAGTVFTFTGDDDVWVYINGRLVIDLGGVHSALSQTIELDRYADILDPDGTNTLHFFFAERHRTQSNFRIETSLRLKSANLPSSAHVYD